MQPDPGIIVVRIPAEKVASISPCDSSFDQDLKLPLLPIFRGAVEAAENKRDEIATKAGEDALKTKFKSKMHALVSAEILRCVEADITVRADLTPVRASFGEIELSLVDCLEHFATCGCDGHREIAAHMLRNLHDNQGRAIGLRALVEKIIVKEVQYSKDYHDKWVTFALSIPPEERLVLIDHTPRYEKTNHYGPAPVREKDNECVARWLLAVFPQSTLINHLIVDAEKPIEKHSYNIDRCQRLLLDIAVELEREGKYLSPDILMRIYRNATARHTIREAGNYLDMQAAAPEWREAIQRFYHDCALAHRIRSFDELITFAESQRRGDGAGYRTHILQEDAIERYLNLDAAEATLEFAALLDEWDPFTIQAVALAICKKSYFSKSQLPDNYGADVVVDHAKHQITSYRTNPNFILGSLVALASAPNNRQLLPVLEELVATVSTTDVADALQSLAGQKRFGVNESKDAKGKIIRYANYELYETTIGQVLNWIGPATFLNWIEGISVNGPSDVLARKAQALLVKLKATNEKELRDIFNTACVEDPAFETRLRRLTGLVGAAAIPAAA